MAKSIRNDFEWIKGIQIWVYVDKKQKPQHLKNPWHIRGLEEHDYGDLPEFDESLLVKG